MAYRSFSLDKMKDSVFLTARASAMVCWLFVGSAVFSAVFALLGGQQLVEEFIMGLNLGPVGFLILTQIIIFILGWPLEWTEIIVIFLPIFLPLLDNFGIDPIFFGVLVALNLQTSFLSPPRGDGAILFEGRGAEARLDRRDLHRRHAVPVHRRVRDAAALLRCPGFALWLPSALYNGRVSPIC